MDEKEYEVMNSVESVHWWYVARRKVIDKIIRFYIFKPLENTEILDIGCGTGGNIPMLAKYGKVVALESDEKAIQLAREKIGEGGYICKGELPYGMNFRVESQKFDLITMFDVLEHIDDRDGTLREIKKLLGRNGVLCLTLPAYMFLWNKSDVTAGHKIRYSTKKISEELRKEGFRIKYISYFNCFLFLPSALGKLLFKLNKNYTPAAEFGLKFPKCVNFMLEKIFALEAVLLPQIRYPFGTSLIVIAEADT